MDLDFSPASLTHHPLLSMFLLHLTSPPFYFMLVSSLALPTVVPVALFLGFPYYFSLRKGNTSLNPTYYLHIDRKYKKLWNFYPTCVNWLSLAIVLSETFLRCVWYW